jgi:hypothetical protein
MSPEKLPAAQVGAAGVVGRRPLCGTPDAVSPELGVFPDFEP